MRILLDQGTPVAIRYALFHHLVRTAYEEGWSDLSNGELLTAAESHEFDVLLTTDSHLPDQQNLRNRKIAIVILTKNRWILIKPRLEKLSPPWNPRNQARARSRDRQRVTTTSTLIIGFVAVY